MCQCSGMDLTLLFFFPLLTVSHVLHLPLPSCHLPKCLQGVRSLGRARQRTWDCLSRLPSVYFLFIFGVAFRHLSLFCRRKKKKRIHSHREDRKKTKRKTGIFCLGVLPAYPHLCNSFFLSFIAIFLQALPTSLLSHIPLFPTLLFLFIRHLNPHQQ